MNDTYEIVDDYIAEEFKSSLYKMFAYQCGAYLAQCFLGQIFVPCTQEKRIQSALTVHGPQCDHADLQGNVLIECIARERDGLEIRTEYPLPLVVSMANEVSAPDTLSG